MYKAGSGPKPPPLKSVKTVHMDYNRPPDITLKGWESAFSPGGNTCDSGDTWIGTTGWDMGYTSKCVDLSNPANACFKLPSHVATALPRPVGATVENLQCTYPSDYVQTPEDMVVLADMHADGDINDTAFNALTVPYCMQTTEDGGPRLASDPSCQHWCTDNPDQCDKMKKEFCNANPGHSLCQCINPDKDPGYKDFMARRIASGLPVPNAPVHCWWPGCKKTTGASSSGVFKTNELFLAEQKCTSAPLNICNQNVTTAKGSSGNILDHPAFRQVCPGSHATSTTGGAASTGGGTSVQEPEPLSGGNKTTKVVAISLGILVLLLILLYIVY